MRMHSLVLYNWKICEYYWFHFAWFQMKFTCSTLQCLSLCNMLCYVHSTHTYHVWLNFRYFRNLGENKFPSLPKKGLNRILHLKTFNNPKLREFPAPETFPRIQVCNFSLFIFIVYLSVLMVTSCAIEHTLNHPYSCFSIRI